MPITQLALPTGSSPARYGHAGATRLVNCYSEAVEEGKTGVNIHACDGFDLFATGETADPVSTIFALSDAEAYAKIGRQIVKIDPAGALTSLGGLPADGYCTMARNRAAVPDVVLVSDGLVYKIKANVLSQISDPDLPPATSVCQVSGYFAFQLADGRMFSSALDDVDVVALDYAAANSSPDGGVRCYARGQDLISFGRESTEFWSDQGNEGFPFGFVTSRSVGLLAIGAVATVNQTVAFVANDYTVRILNGYDAEKISGHDIDRLIRAELDPSVITCFSWTIDGHVFLAVSGSTWTKVYDLATKKWHDRESYGLNRWRVGCAARFGNSTLFGDYANGKIYRLNPDTYTEAGEHLVMKVQFPTSHGFPYRIRNNALFLDVVPGVGLVSSDPAVADPQAMMDYSDDGGANFSTQRMASIGAAGDRLRRVRFNRLGVSRSRIYRVSISAAVARSVVTASLDADKLAA
jgi:hypothetical protein